MAESDRISAAARTNNRIRSEEVTTAERLVHPNVVSRRPRTVLQTSWDLRVRSCGRMAPSLSSGKWSNPRYGRSLRLLQGQLELLIPVCPGEHQPERDGQTGMSAPRIKSRKPVRDPSGSRPD